MYSRSKRTLIRCQIANHDFPEDVKGGSEGLDQHDKLKYIALSYTWGDASKKFIILLNDSLFEVRRNLYEFLVTMRDKDCKSTFWIDQLCIDQENITERNIQVQMMADIYRQAEAVHVWLGPATASTSRAMEILKSLEHRILKVKSMDDYFEFQGPKLVEILREVSLVKKDVRAIVKVFGHPYWSRLWIAQELILASQILLLQGRFEYVLPCSEEFAGEIFARVLEALEYHREVTETDYAQSIISNCVYSRETRSQASLYTILVAHHTRRCSDLRDKVFGLTSCVADNSRVEIDYSLSVEEVYDRTANVLESERESKDVPIDHKKSLLINLQQDMGLLRSESDQEAVNTAPRTTIFGKKWKNLIKTIGMKRS